MTEGADDGNGRIIRYQVGEHAKKLDRLEDWRKVVDEDRTTVKGDLRALHTDNVELRKEMAGLRRVLVALLSTIAASTVIFSLSILLATGKL